jgi:hypothetical protein
VRRAFFVETATGHSQWEMPLVDSQYATREMPPPAAPPVGGYYQEAPPPPQGYYEGEPQKEKKDDSMKKAMMGGAIGLAAGAAIGAFAMHEHGMFSELPIVFLWWLYGANWCR